MNPDDLPRFDESATCRKCGGGEVRSAWVDPDTPWAHHDCPAQGVEHIERGCERCGFQWQEAPIDADDDRCCGPVRPPFPLPVPHDPQDESTSR